MGNTPGNAGVLPETPIFNCQEDWSPPSDKNFILNPDPDRSRFLYRSRTIFAPELRQRHLSLLGFVGKLENTMPVAPAPGRRLHHGPAGRLARLVAAPGMRLSGAARFASDFAGGHRTPCRAGPGFVRHSLNCYQPVIEVYYASSACMEFECEFLRNCISFVIMMVTVR